MVRAYDPVIQYEETRDRVISWADAVVIATPTNRHWIDVEDTFNHQKPVFVEKPIVSTVTEWNNLRTPFIKMVGYNLRFHTCVIRAKKWIGEGLIGKPLWARFTCAQYNDRPAYLRDGVILNWSHELDLALHLLGRATVRACVASHNVNEDLADIILQHHPTLCQTLVHLDYLTKWERRGFVIVGEDGSIEADIVKRQAFLRDNKGSLPQIHYGRGSFDGDYLAEARAFLDRLEGKETLGCTADEAMQVANICLLAKEKSGG